MTVLTAITARINRVLPEVPGKITRHTPAPVMKVFLNTAVNHLLQKERTTGELDFLKGHTAAVVIKDLDFSFSMTLANNRLNITTPAQPADATLKSDQASMLAILHGEVDPDTLFFRRKLLITGDTELGLYIKNLIDTINLTERIPAPLMKFLTRIHQNSI